jgi:hypothetical protein
MVSSARKAEGHFSFRGIAGVQGSQRLDQAQAQSGVVAPIGSQQRLITTFLLEPSVFALWEYSEGIFWEGFSANFDGGQNLDGSSIQFVIQLLSPVSAHPFHEHAGRVEDDSGLPSFHHIRPWGKKERKFLFA